MAEKIALLVDSAMDTPKEILDKGGIFIAPLNIIYKNETFLDRVEITPMEVYNHLEIEIPTTSLPTLPYVENLISDIKKSLKCLELYKNIKKDDDSGRNAVANHLNSVLNALATKLYLNKGDIDIIKELRAGKIVIIDVSSFNENILNIINLAIYTRLQNAICETMKPVSIIIDEAQKVLNKDYFRANSDGLAKDSNDFYIYETDTGKLFYDADGNGSGKSKQIALIENKASLTYADFVVL